MTRFHRPNTLEGAVKLLQRPVPSQVIAGGQSLVPELRRGERQAEHLVAIDRLGDLLGIVAHPDSLQIGGAETHHQIGNSEIVRNALPALSDLALSIGDPQVRHRGTIGGALVARPHSTDYLAALFALDGRLQTSRQDRDIFQALTPARSGFLEKDELIVSITMRRPEAALYQKHAHRAAGYAELGLFCARWPDQTCSVALIGEDLIPTRTLIPADQPLSTAQPGLVAQSALSPFSAALLKDFLRRAEDRLHPRKN